MLLLTKSDLAQINIPPADILALIKESLGALAAGKSANPEKIVYDPCDKHSVAYSMLAQDAVTKTVGFKTSYKYAPQESKIKQKYYTTLSLYDDNTGQVIGLLDGAKIGALRTPAVTAVILEQIANPSATSLLLIGTGTQGQNMLPFILTALPSLRTIYVYGTWQQGLDIIARSVVGFPVTIHILSCVEQVHSIAAHVDVIVAASGPHTEVNLGAAECAPGVAMVLVGYGLGSRALQEADYVIATSAAQMRVTGKDLADAHGVLRTVDAELPQILTQSAHPRRSKQDKVFAFNSGLVITDVVLGMLFVDAAKSAGIGSECDLWA